MTALGTLSDRLAGLIDLGGPVIAVLLCLSILALSVVFFKLWQFRALGVGRHAGLKRALAAWDAGRIGEARSATASSPSHLGSLLQDGMERIGAKASAAGLKDRLTAQAEERLNQVESGFRLLDSIAQVAPLLGLFGTVLGMIDAFRALQEAGNAVDPSVLAGGIWVALLTTAVGLAVAMPTALMLTWLESRAARERAQADLAIERLFCPLPPGSYEAERPVAEAATVDSRLELADGT